MAHWQLHFDASDPRAAALAAGIERALDCAARDPAEAHAQDMSSLLRSIRGVAAAGGAHAFDGAAGTPYHVARQPDGRIVLWAPHMERPLRCASARAARAAVRRGAIPQPPTLPVRDDGAGGQWAAALALADRALDAAAAGRRVRVRARDLDLRGAAPDAALAALMAHAAELLDTSEEAPEGARADAASVAALRALRARAAEAMARRGELHVNPHVVTRLFFRLD